MRKDVALALLGIQDESLSPERINEAYRAAMQMNHPDRYATNEQLRKHAEEQCKLINEARTTLLSWVRNEEERQSAPQCEATSSKTDAEGKGQGSEPQDAGPTRPTSFSYADYRRTRRPTFWERNKNRIVGVVVVALLIAAWLTPATIPVPSRSVDDLKKDGDVANLILMETRGETATMEILGDPDNFAVQVDVKLSSDLEPDIKGIVGKPTGKLVFDGSYEYDYEFYFPREGNLLQSLLTRLGIWNCNLPFMGHVTGYADTAEEYYEFSDIGLGATFPGEPTKYSSNNYDSNGYLGSSGPTMTSVERYELANDEIAAFYGGLGEMNEEERTEWKTKWLTAAVKELAELFQIENVDTSNMEILGAERIGDFGVLAFFEGDRAFSEEAEAQKVFLYYGFGVDDKGLWDIFGWRMTEESARKAAESFALLPD